MKLVIARNANLFLQSFKQPELSIRGRNKNNNLLKQNSIKMNQEVPPMSNRIMHIDQLKGFAIVLIVLGHIQYFTFESTHSLIGMLTDSVQIPIFLFISGYLTSHTPGSIKEKLISKAKRLLIPFIFTGMLWMLYSHFTLSEFMFQDFKKGYWFTYVLFLFFILFFFINQFTYKIKNIVYDFIVWGSVCVGLGLVLKFQLISGATSAFLSYPLIFHYFPFFIGGVLMKKYPTFFSYIEEHNLFFTLSLILYGICFAFLYQTEHSLYKIGVNIFGLYVCYALFKSFANKILFGKALSYLGKKSLEIYLIHYFFLSSIATLWEGSSFTMDNLNFVLRLLVSMLLALLVISCSIGISYIVGYSKLLGFLFLGKKYK